MTDSKTTTVEISSIPRFVREFSSFGEDYVYARIDAGDIHPSDMISPWYFDGAAIVLLLNASGRLTVNFDTFEVPRNSVIVIDEGTTIHTDSDGGDNAANAANMEAYLLFLSKKFLQSVNIDPNALGHHYYPPRDSPMLTLSDDDAALVLRYLHLLDDNAKMPVDSNFRVSIARNLIANIFYLLLDIDRRRAATGDERPTAPRSRRVNYVNDFIKLVRQHYREQRSVGFYADRLYITPKYLSLVIKETTGRSAAQWIARYVVVEAKNMLRFSGKNIQQVAYELNFPNQSSFGKYFKHSTGMSPSEFQRS